jgi:hypothetical protein
MRRRKRYEVQTFAGRKLIADHVTCKSFAYGPGFDFSQAPAQEHRAFYSDSDAKAIVEWLNTEFVGTPVGL